MVCYSRARSGKQDTEGLNVAGVILERRGYGPGDVIFKEGSRGDCAYLVKNGSIEIYKTIDDKEKILGAIGKGGIFGEMALIDDTPRMGSSRAVEVTQLVVISRMMFNRKLEKADPFIRGLLNIFADNIRRITPGDK